MVKNGNFRIEVMKMTPTPTNIGLGSCFGAFGAPPLTNWTRRISVQLTSSDVLTGRELKPV